MAGNASRVLVAEALALGGIGEVAAGLYMGCTPHSPATKAGCKPAGPQLNFRTMIDTFKKTLLAGLGAAVVTSERVQAGLEDFVRQGKISATDARAMAEKIAGDGKREFEDVSAKLGDKVRELMAHTEHKHVARIAALEARMDALEGKHEKAARHKAKP